jgi:hypothetical protein
VVLDGEVGALTDILSGGKRRSPAEPSK